MLVSTLLYLHRKCLVEFTKKKFRDFISEVGMGGLEAFEFHFPML